MKQSPGKTAYIFLCSVILFFSAYNSKAFALQGPVQSWMAESDLSVLPDIPNYSSEVGWNIGGPVPIGSGYRWNVPTVTYGFDQSFLNYFGSNGVAAVEGAIQILNALPPASQIDLNNYPTNTLQINYSAVAQSLVDLKSTALALLLPEMGLAPPRENIYVLHNLNDIFYGSGYGQGDIVEGMPIDYEDIGWYSGVPEWGTGDITNFIWGLNFDPETLTESSSINGVGYWAELKIDAYQQYYFDLSAIGTPPIFPEPTIAESFPLGPGLLATGLTRDDVGGLRYLLTSNNVCFETLLSGITGLCTNSFVNGALRGGIEKITFVLQTSGVACGMFLPMTNQFTDNYLSNGVAMQQQLQRVTTSPDFLFSAGNEPFITGTTNWINNAASNNNDAGSGPGNITPPILLKFQKLGCTYVGQIGSEEEAQNETSEVGVYGSFDASTNPPIVYPVPQVGSVLSTLQVMLSHTNLEPPSQGLELITTNQYEKVFSFETSTNFSAWITLFQVTNNGSLTTYYNSSANSPARFYRLVAQ